MCHPQGAMKDFTKGKVLQLPVTTSSKILHVHESKIVRKVRKPDIL